MHREEQNMILQPESQERRAQHRAASQIEGPRGFFFSQAARCRLALFIRQGAEV